MQKRGISVGMVFIISIFLIIILIGLMFYYFAFSGKDYSSVYDEKISNGEIINPVYGLNLEEAKDSFDEKYVYYLLYVMKAYNLKTPPLTKDYPKIEIDVEGEAYNGIISDGKMVVNLGEINNEDLFIKTSREEIIKVIEDKNYLTKSVEDSKTNIEMKSSKSLLLAKGYLKLYQDITGKGITGNVIRFYID